MSISLSAFSGNHKIQVCRTTDLVLSGKVNFFVQVPLGLKVLKQEISNTRFPNPLPNGCPPGMPYGMQLRVRYQVLDQSGQDIKSLLPIRENLLNLMVNGGSLPDRRDRMPTTSGNTEADGTFIDDGVGVCTEIPFIIASFTQELFVPLSPNEKPIVRINKFTISVSEKKGCGMMLNGTDLNVNVQCP